MVRTPLIIILLGLTIFTHAQSNCIRIDLLGIVSKRIGISYERSFSKHFSGQFSFEKANYDQGETNGQKVYNLSGIGVIPEFRYYPLVKKKSAPLGLFIGGAFRYVKLTEEYIPNKINLKGDLYNLGINTGYKFNYDQFTLELLLGYGGGFTKGFDEERQKSIDPFYLHSITDVENFLRVEISVGIIFPWI